jgi:flagellar protein FlaG
MAIDAVSKGFGVNVSVPLSTSKVESNVQSAPVKVDIPVSVPFVAEPQKYQPVSSEPSSTESKIQTRKDDKISVAQESDFFKKVLKEDETNKRRTKQEEEQKAREDESRKEEMQKLTEELNKKVNQFSASIKFGFNDKTNSIAVSMMDGAKEASVKQISPQEATKLADRMSYVLGILFDQKG